MSDALQRLIDAVEAGDRPHELTKEVFGHDSLNMMHAMCALNPKHPDLNCAISLAQSLLPGWNWLVRSEGGIAFANVMTDDFLAESDLCTAEGETLYKGKLLAGASSPVTSSTPARALILAILRAYQQVQQ